MAEQETSLDEVYRWFRACAEKSFAFLESECGCSRRTRDEGPDGIFMRFQNETTGVEVGYEPMDEVVEVFLIKLENGRAPPYLDSWQRNWVPLSRYLDRVGAIGPEVPGTVRWGDRVAMGDVLGRWAQALHEHGQTVLRGDFSIFDDAPAPDLSDTETYEIGTPGDASVGADESRRPRSFPVQLAAWVARRLGRIVRRE
jgi:hypothetical protein